MNNTKNIFYTIFQVIGCLALFGFTFMGGVYTFTDYIMPLIIAFLSLVILLVLSYYLETWKGKKVRANDEYNSKTPEFIIGGIYFLIATNLFLFCSHYFNLEFYQKDKVKEEVNNRIYLISDMNDKYEIKVDQLVSEIRRCASSKFEDLKIKSIRDRPDLLKTTKRELDNCLEIETDGNSDTSFYRNAINKKISYIQNTKYGIDSVVAVGDYYIKEWKGDVTEWDPTKIKFTCDGIDSKVNLHFELLRKKMPEFNYQLSQEKINFPTIFSSFSSTPLMNIFLGFFIYVCIHVCILAKYFFFINRHKGLLRTTDTNIIEGDIANKI
jgi:hypothetical protein